MRAVAVVGLLLIAGCAQTPPLVPVSAAERVTLTPRERSDFQNACIASSDTRSSLIDVPKNCGCGIDSMETFFTKADWRTFAAASVATSPSASDVYVAIPKLRTIREVCNRQSLK